MQKLRKAFVLSVMTITVFSMSMMAVPLQVDAAAMAGDLIKMDGLASVYYYASDGKRYVFPNETTYFSWYSDFSGVKTISQAELEAIDLGKNVTIRPGTKLVKITTNPNVYAVEPGGDLIRIPDEATAEALYGANWADRVVDVPDAFFNNYSITGEEASTDAYPTGSLVKYGAAADIYYIDENGEARAIEDEAAFNANRFKFSDVIETAMEVSTLGDPITGAVSGLIDTSSGAGGQAGAGTGLTVAISGDTPSAGNIPGSSPVDFLKVNLTAANDGDVSINSLKIRSFDLGDPDNINDVIILDNGVRQGTSKNINSDKEATFNFATPIKVAAGTTKTLTVRATIAVTTGNYALGINAAADVMTNGAVVSGSFPIVGNSKAAVDGSSSVGTVTMSSVTDDTGAAAEFGEDNILLAGFTLAAANEDVIWESATFKNIGTNDDGIVDNMRIEVDGDAVVEGVGIADKYAVFNMGNHVIAKGDTVTVEVYGDAGVANVDNTIHLVVDTPADFSFVGQGTGYGAVTSGFDLLDQSTEGVKVTLSAGDFTVDMDKAATPARDVRRGTDNVVLATVKMTSNGEDATVDQIVNSVSDDFVITGSGLDEDGEITNVEMYDVDAGTIYDITATYDAVSDHYELSMTDEIFFQKGVTKTFQIRADLQGPNDSTPIENNDTLQVTMANGAFTITGETSSADLDTSPSSVTGSLQTVKDASLIWTTTPLTAQTVVGNAEDITIYMASLKVGSASDVTLQSVRIDVDDTPGNFETFTDDNFASIDLYIDGALAKSNAKIAGTDGTATAYVNFTSLNSSARTIAAGETVYVEVKATFASDLDPTGDMKLHLKEAASVVARDDNNDAFDIAPANALTNSRTITLEENGSLKVELKTDDSKANKDTYVLAGGSTEADRYLGELVFTASNEDILVKTLALGQVGDATNEDILAVQLFDEDGALVAQEGVDGYGNVYFDALDMVFTADQATSMFIGVVAKSINADGDNQGTANYLRDIQFNLASSTQLTELGLSANKAVTAQGNDSGVTIDLTQAVTNTPGDDEYQKATTSSKTSTITGSILTSIANAMADATMVGKQNETIAKYTFVFDNGSNRTDANEALKAQLVKLDLAIATTSATVTNIRAYIEGDSANKLTATEAAAGVITLDLDEAGGLAEDGLVDGEITLVVTGDVAKDGSANNGSISTEIADLSTGDFTYDGDNGDGTDITNPRLDITDVSGGVLTF